MQVMLGMASYLTVRAHWWLHGHRVQNDDAHRDGAGVSSGTWQRTLSRAVDLHVVTCCLKVGWMVTGRDTHGPVPPDR